MIEFNSDGSIKLPDSISKFVEQRENKLKKERCVLIKKDVVSFTSPKKCVLNIKLSDAFSDNSFVQTIYDYFQNSSQVPSKLTKINEKEFLIEIGTDFRRCSDCCSLLKKFRDFLDNNIIEDKGNCTFENKKEGNFSYEDYF